MSAANRFRKIEKIESRTVRGQRTSGPLLPALVALGGVATALAAPANALELGELKIDSSLGQPLRASIAYALNPHEELYDFCMSLTKGVGSAGLPALTRANITVVDNRIVLRGNVPIKEPLLSMRLTVDCPYTAHLARDYMLMIDPPAAVQSVNQTAAAAAAVVTTAPQVAVPVAQSGAPTAAAPRPAVVAKVADASPIQTGSRYRVQRGDSLSGIASRIADRPVGLWQAVDAIFVANPKAFNDGDVNRLMAGSILTIPELQQSAAVESTQAGAATAVGNDLPTTGSAYEGYNAATAEEIVATNNHAVPVTVDTADATADESPVESPIVEFADDTAVLGSGATDANTETAVVPVDRVAAAQPGDVFAAPEVTTNAAAEPTESASEDAPGESTWTWLKWLAGSGLALIVGLLLFGRRLRERFGGDRADALHPAHDRRISDSDITQNAEVISDVDYAFDDTAPGDRAIELDADLDAGTGLQAGNHMDVAQDFGFSGTTGENSQLDMEFSAESAGEVETLSTDIIPVRKAGRESILDSEIPPNDDDDGEYDLSMIVDATKQALGDMEGTARDLMAVQMDSASDESDNAYTLSQEVDYKILEKDYEDELTATQALNQEIAKAALELAERMEIDGATVEMPAAGDSSDDTAAIDVTANLEQSRDAEITAELTVDLPTNALAQNDDCISDLDDTGVNEELTAEMDIESGTIDTKKIAR